MTSTVATEENMEQFTEGDPLKEKEAERETPPRSFSEKCSYILKNVTVEPTMALFVLAAIMNMLATQNLSLEKACRVNLNFTDEICSSLKLQQVGANNEHEKATQQLLTHYISARTYITATIPSVLSLFAGSFSDKTGRRKMFLIYALCGQMLMCVTNMLNTYFFYELNLQFLTFSEAIIEGLTGGFAVPMFIMFAYISTVTTDETRTFRMGLLNFALTVGFPIGMMLSGVLLKRIGYYGCYGMSFVFHFVNFIYNTFILKEHKRTLEQKRHDNKGFVHHCRLFFSLTNIVETVRVVFRSGKNYRRLRMVVYMAVVAILFGPLFGELSVLYLSTRYRFNWDEVQFSYFQVYNFVTHTVGTIFSITVFSKIWGWHDSILGILATVSKIASSFVYCFATNARIFYLAPLVEILNGTSLLAMRSIVSKLVDTNELGKVNSIFSLTENLMPLLYVPLYTSVYKATMDVLPGAVFLMGAVMTVPAVIVFSWLLYEHRRGVRLEKSVLKEAEAQSKLMEPN